MLELRVRAVLSKRALTSDFDITDDVGFKNLEMGYRHHVHKIICPQICDNIILHIKVHLILKSTGIFDSERQIKLVFNGLVEVNVTINN